MVKKTKDIQYYEATGRRKEAVARVRLYIGGKAKAVTINNKPFEKGDFLVNDKPYGEIFKKAVDTQRLLRPFELTNNHDRFVATVRVTGGGREGQIEAIVHGIARALCLVDADEYRPLLKQHGLLMRDSRTRERRKVGTGGKARRAKQSPKR